MVSREAEFDDEQRELALALTFLEDVSCSGCGNDLRVSLERGHSWDVDDKTRCWACASKETVERDDHEAHKNDKPMKGRPAYFDGRFYTVGLFTEDGEK